MLIFLDKTSAPSAYHRLEGRSLEPILHGQTHDYWRVAVFSEVDYDFYAARKTLGTDPSRFCVYMIRTRQWKYTPFPGWPPQPFDLRSDPKEYHQLGRSPDHNDARHEVYDHLTIRLLQRKNRTTITKERALKARDGKEVICLLIGKWAPTRN